MLIALGERTAETVETYFRRTRDPEIQKNLPQRAQTLEEALADYRKTLEPGARSFGRTIYADGRYVGDIWCYAMGPENDPQAMVSYCVFERELWGRGAAAKALGCFWRSCGSGSALSELGRLPMLPTPGLSACWRKTAFNWKKYLQRTGENPAITGMNETNDKRRFPIWRWI